MKLLLCLICNLWCMGVVLGQTTFEILNTQPTYPQSGKSLSFVYNSKGGSLSRAKGINCIVYYIDEKEIRAEDVILSQENEAYSGKISIPRNADALILSFQEKYQNSNNKINSEAYPIKLFVKEQQIKENSYAALAKGYHEWSIIAGHEKDNGLIIAWLEQEFKAHPHSKAQFLDLYLTALKDDNPEKNKPVIIKELESFALQKEAKKEEDLLLLHKWYANLYDDAKKEYFTTTIKQQYPKGIFVSNEKYIAFVQEENIQQKKIIYDHFKKDFPKSENIKSIQLNLAYQFANNGNWEAFEDIVSAIKMKDKASLYNSLAWEWAERESNLEKAKELSAQTAEYAKYQLNQSESKPLYISVNQWRDVLKRDYATYADTYGFVLYRLGNYGLATQYLKDASDIFVNNPEVNERYTLALEKSMPITNTTLLKTELEKFVKTGTASEKMKRQLQQYYGKEKGSLQGYDIYLDGLEAGLKQEIRDGLKKKLLNEPIPDFKLLDLEGKNLSLADFKGKTVIINFWATWCEDCTTALPFLQKILEKYKGNSSVIFLFVSTWENQGDIKKTISNFLEKHEYKFPVFIDKYNRVSVDFKVGSIFAKIIIDKNGNIRFKNTEIIENYDQMKQELELMIDMVNELN
ncbi:MAG: TlpA family protein disulfide reductase [Thermoflexibacter sp.]|nr:TlpA family protein disulfide reductase [Thermoflexibacter sp.]